MKNHEGCILVGSSLKTDLNEADTDGAEKWRDWPRDQIHIILNMLKA